MMKYCPINQVRQTQRAAVFQSLRGTRLRSTRSALSRTARERSLTLALRLHRRAYHARLGRGERGRAAQRAAHSAPIVAVAHQTSTKIAPRGARRTGRGSASKNKKCPHRNSAKAPLFVTDETMLRGQRRTIALPHARSCARIETLLILAYPSVWYCTTRRSRCQAVIHIFFTALSTVCRNATFSPSHEACERGAARARASATKACLRRLAIAAKLQNKPFCVVGLRGAAALPSPLVFPLSLVWRFLPANHKMGILYSCAAHTPRLCLCPCRGSLRGGSLAGFPTFSSCCASHAPRARTTAQAAPSLHPPSACFGL